jgi:hypothetical protein
MVIWCLYGLNGCEEDFKEYSASRFKMTRLHAKERKTTGFNQIIRFLLDFNRLLDITRFKSNISYYRGGFITWLFAP